MLRSFVLLSLAFLPAAARAQSSADSAGIRSTALDYAEGWYTGDADRMARAVATASPAASTWKVTDPAPASAYPGAQRSGASIIRWQSSGTGLTRASASTTGRPSVRLGTKWLSMTSTCAQSAEAMRTVTRSP